jgi:dimeric dUTPase (all-alpha-NTP-PPase superfamily)
LTQEVSEDRLKMIFSLQKGLAEMMNLDRYPKDVEGRVAALCTAIVHEAIELQRTTNWKWWKKPTKFNEAEAREELIDIWHFVVQASLELKLSPDDILEEYKRKNEINRERQRNGY